MKPAVIDVNVFLDLIKLQMLAWLYKTGFFIYTTQEIIDLLNENQCGYLKKFIESDQLTVYRLSEKELEEAVSLTAIRSLELSDKSVAWLSIHLNGIVISDNPVLKRFCRSGKMEVEGMIWLMDLLIEKRLIQRAFAAQKMIQLLKINRSISREECEKRIKEWENPTTCIL